MKSAFLTLALALAASSAHALDVTCEAQDHGEKVGKEFKLHIQHDDPRLIQIPTEPPHPTIVFGDKEIYSKNGVQFRFEVYFAIDGNPIYDVGGIQRIGDDGLKTGAQASQSSGAVVFTSASAEEDIFILCEMTNFTPNEN